MLLLLVVTTNDAQVALRMETSTGWRHEPETLISNDPL